MVCAVMLTSEYLLNRCMGNSVFMWDSLVCRCREDMRERERERIFIQINRNNDTIIIQCMDYTD